MSLAILWSCLAVAVFVVIQRQFRTIEALVPLDEPPPDPPPLAVVLPVRNEAANIERCLRGLLNQVYPQLDIVIVNDGSTDDTVSIARRVAGHDARVRIIEAGPMPAGWVGKSNACWQGAAAAAAEWLCFIDCDTFPSSPSLLGTAVAAARRRNLDMLSFQPFQELGTFWERLVYPSGFILLLLSLNVRRINDLNKPDAAANGQLMLIRRAAYEAVGGHGHPAVRGAIVEDMALARAVKQAGFRLGLMRADALVSTRMYIDLHAMWIGFSRIVVDVFHGPPGSIVAALGALLVGWLPIALFVGAVVRHPAEQVALAILAAGVAAMLATYFRVTTYLKIPAWYGLLFPLGYTMGAAITLNGVWQRLTRTVQWKGRRFV